MNAEQFIESIKIVVVESTITNTIENLEELPDSNVDLKENVLHSWYNNLSQADQNIVKVLIRRVVESSTFGFLCVLDGVRAIENGSDKGTLELYHVKEDNRVLLNDFNQDFLHDIYR